MPYDDVEKFRQDMEALRRLGGPDVDGVVFQSALDAGVAAILEGWRDVRVTPTFEAGAVVRALKGTREQPRAIVELEITGSDSAVIRERVRALSVAWDGNSLKDVRKAMKIFLEAIDRTL